MTRFKVSLFKSKKEIFFSFAILLFIFFFNIFLEYKNYEKLTASKYYRTKAYVLNQYKKKRGKREYFVLKLKTPKDAVFYTTNYEDLKNIKNREIFLTVVTKNISFLDYLKGFYAPSFDIRLYPKEHSFKDFLQDFISSSHSESEMRELFLALFLGEPISKDLRGKIQFLGVSHLIAISGFHLGVLFSLFFFLINIFYKPLQDRFFPYRNRRFDISVLVMIVLFFYLYMLDFIPSLLRAFVMMVLGFLFYLRAIEVFSFTTLLTAVLLIISFFPKLLFSIGFWFSVSGVFYIFLFLKYFKSFGKTSVFILLNFWVFFMMMPIVHYFFPIFSFYQLFSPFISMIFVVFYPLELLLHFMGLGDILDGTILKLFSLKGKIYNFKTDLWFLALFVFVNIAAVFQRVFFVLFILLFIIYFIQNITKFHPV